jgi:hypothetical protein
VLLISIFALFAVIIGTLFFSKEEPHITVPVATSAPEEEHIPRIFENWGLWITVIILSNIIMWGPVILSAFNLTLGFWSPGDAAGLHPGS